MRAPPSPPVPPWATILFGIHEESVLAQFRYTLKLYRRFINNVLGICLVDPGSAKDYRKWTSLTLLMKYYYGLVWNFKECPMTVNVIDMTISIHKDRIVTLLYEKFMLLYLYIVSHSAHPLGVLIGLVSSNILCTHSLCSNDYNINLA